MKTAMPTVGMPPDDDDDSSLTVPSSTAATRNVLPVLVSLSEILDVVSNQQVTTSAGRWHVLFLMKPLLVILVSAVLQTKQYTASEMLQLIYVEIISVLSKQNE